MKTVALFGGSFNPPHPAHFDMGAYIEDTLNVDEVWFLFSVNHQKDETEYASAEHRMAMGDLLNKHYPDNNFVMSDIQDKLGTHMTYEVLCELKKRYPDVQFIWVMGADQLVDFHTWENFEKIIEEFPIAVVDRPPYTERAKAGYTALTYHHLQTTDLENFPSGDNGWCFLKNPLIDMSSSSLLEKLRAGQRQFDGPFQEIADYAVEHQQYGITNTPSGPKPLDGPKPS